MFLKVLESLLKFGKNSFNCTKKYFLSLKLIQDTFHFFINSKVFLSLPKTISKEHSSRASIMVLCLLPTMPEFVISDVLDDMAGLVRPCLVSAAAAVS